MLNYLCVGRFGLGWAHDDISVAHHMLAFSCIRTLHSIYFYIFELFGTFLSVTFFPLTLLFTLVCQWHQNVSMLRPRTLFVPRYCLLLILPPILFSSMVSKPKRTSRRTILDEVFIWNAESFFRTSPTLTYPLSFTVGVGSHCVTSWSPVHLCWSKSFTSTCMDSILQYLSFILTFEVCA